uniref:THAP9-like helix-turn-helix domain-containing protein n=1 Tax=Dendroctonus ponderosae TaxID=77166 RepID=A0AAR5P3G2_DENPD
MSRNFVLRDNSKGGVNVRASGSTAFTGAKARSAAVPCGRRLNLNGLGVTQQKHLSHQAKILYEGVKKLKRAIQRQVRLYENLSKMKLNNSQSALLRNLADVNKFTRNFILSQTRNQKLKPRGRRFSLEDKIFALSIYKQSGKGYRFLSKIFSLPSRKTLVK